MRQPLRFPGNFPELARYFSGPPANYLTGQQQPQSAGGIEMKANYRNVLAAIAAIGIVPTAASPWVAQMKKLPRTVALSLLMVAVLLGQRALAETTKATEAEAKMFAMSAG